jgi:hypothetical protein
MTEPYLRPWGWELRCDHDDYRSSGPGVLLVEDAVRAAERHERENPGHRIPR